jgi:Uma2 family endonuclease
LSDKNRVIELILKIGTTWGRSPFSVPSRLSALLPSRYTTSEFDLGEIPAVVDLMPTRELTIAALDPIWRFTVAQYHQMIDCGVLTEDAPVELLAGCLVQKMTKNPPHRISTRLVREALEAIVPAGWYVETQEPITLVDSEPEPDVAVILGNTRDYSDRHPNGSEVALVIEVADSTLDRDRSIKQTLYAEADIPHYWIVNLRDRTIEVYQSPIHSSGTAHYRDHKSISLGDLPVQIGDRIIGTLSVPSLFV